jgi:16S rRNA G966 N2-methylase RsmD
MNSQKRYLYGKNREGLKKILHDIIISNIDRTKELSSILGFKIIMPQKKSFRDRKIEIIKQARKKNEMLAQFLILEHLNRIEIIENIKKLSFIMPIEFKNKSYNKVKIETPIDETILYIDPPYKDKFKYQNDIEHNELWDYIASSPYTIYLSSYEAPFPLVAEFDHFSSVLRNKKTTERLFCNKKNKKI